MFCLIKKEVYRYVSVNPKENLMLIGTVISVKWTPGNHDSEHNGLSLNDRENMRNGEEGTTFPSPTG